MLSKKEEEIMKVLFKDFTIEYNAASISNKVKMTPRGALKALKNLERKEFVVPKHFGKAIRYSINFNNLTKKTLELILLEEAERKYKRWVEEFKDLEEAGILILFGSVLKNKEYKDIDLLIIIKSRDYRTVMNIIDKKNKLLIKPIHPIIQTIEDLKNNILKKDEVILDALRTGIALKNQEEIINLIENVTSNKTY